MKKIQRILKVWVLVSLFASILVSVFWRWLNISDQVQALTSLSLFWGLILHFYFSVILVNKEEPAPMPEEADFKRIIERLNKIIEDVRSTV